jgi:acyl-CoA carboxylase epsilon subunit
VTERAGGLPDGAGAAAGPTPEERRALFRVVRGTPTDEELAALTVVLAALAAAPRPGPRPAAATATAWNDPAARLRGPLRRGAGAWRASTWPH